MQSMYQGFDPTQEQAGDGCSCQNGLIYDFTLQQWVKKTAPHKPSCGELLAEAKAENAQLKQELDEAKSNPDCPDVCATLKGKLMPVQRLNGEVIFQSVDVSELCPELVPDTMQSLGGEVIAGGEASAETPTTEQPDPILE